MKSWCDFIELKENRLNYRCKECKGASIKSIKGWIGKFPSVYQFCSGDLNIFILLLRKSICPYECIDSWKKLDEKSLPNKTAFYSELNLEDIAVKDYNHAQKVWEVFGINNLG